MNGTTLVLVLSEEVWGLTQPTLVHLTALVNELTLLTVVELALVLLSLRKKLIYDLEGEGVPLL